MNKKILVFGGTSDIGFTIAKEFMLNDFDVSLIGRNEKKLSNNKLSLEKLGNGNCEILLHDFANVTDTKYDFNNIVSGSALSVVCYGEMLSQELLEKSDNGIADCININLSSQIILINRINNIYKKIGNKSILVVSSVAGDRGKASNYIYGSAKAGLSEYLSGLRQSNFPNKVHVCTIKPGFIYTKMTKHLTLPPLLTSLPSEVGKKAYKAYVSKLDIVYVSGIWKYIMFIIKCIPEFIFKRIKL
jgi:short-subunit dehydrogenase